jgi:hypothetical protein
MLGVGDFRDDFILSDDLDGSTILWISPPNPHIVSLRDHGLCRLCFPPTACYKVSIVSYRFLSNHAVKRMKISFHTRMYAVRFELMSPGSIVHSVTVQRTIGQHEATISC